MAGVGCHTYGTASIEELVPNQSLQLEVRANKIPELVFVADALDPVKRKSSDIMLIRKFLERSDLEGAVKTILIGKKKKGSTHPLLSESWKYAFNREFSSSF